MRPRLTFANVMSVIAVFIALGGASYAAFKVPKNSVGTKQLKKNAVTTAKVKNEAITAAKVKKHTLTGTQIKASTLGTVPNAANAEALGGVSLGQLSAIWTSLCQPGPRPAGAIAYGTIPAAAGICIEEAEHLATTFTEAIKLCAFLNRRLPTMGEMSAFDMQQLGKPPSEWVEPSFQNGSESEANVVTASRSDGSIVSHPGRNLNPPSIPMCYGTFALTDHCA